MRFVSSDHEHCPWGSWRGLAIGAVICTVLVTAIGCTSAPEEEEDDGIEQAAETPETTDDEEETFEETSSDEQAEQTDQQQEATSSSGSSAKQMKVPEGESHPKIEQGVQSAANGDYKRARNQLDEVADDEEFGHLSEYNIAVIDEIEGNPGDAARRYSQALKKNPEFTPALLNVVRLYLRQARAEDAERIARKYTNEESENLDHRAALMEVKIARGQYEEVVREAKSILRRDERNVEAMVAMAKANYWMERYELSKAILNRASELAPERADIYYLFGLVAMDNDEHGRAISNFRKAIEYNARFAEAYNNLGLLYDEAGDHGGAAEQFQAAITYYPDFKEAILNLGNAYKGLGELKKAEEQFKRVLEMESENPDAYFNLGVLYLDAEVPGMDKIPRLKKSIEMLNEYKRVSRGRVSEDDPTDEYLQAAREKIDAEKQRQEMMRESQKD